MASPRSRQQEDPAGSPEPASTSRQSWVTFAFIGIIILAVALRVYAIQKANLWLDELWTLELSCGNDTGHRQLAHDVLIASPPALTSLAAAKPWWTVWTTMDQVTHPPLFFLLLRIWREVLGASDMAARLLPCIASIAAVGLMFRGVRELHGEVPAIFAALLMALCGQQIYFAQETRSYSLIVALGLLGCVLVIAIEKRGDSWGHVISLAASCLAMMLTHYFTVGGIIAIVAYAAVRLSRRALLRIIAALAVAAVIYLVIWGPFLLRQRGAFALEGGNGATDFLIDHQPHHFRDTFLRLAFVPGQTLCITGIYTGAASPLMAGSVLFALIAFLTPLLWIRKQPGLLLWYVWTAGVLLPLLLLDLTRSSMHLQFPKYTMLAGPGICAVLAAGFTALPRLVRLTIPTITAIICAAYVPTTFQLLENVKPDWQPMVTKLAQTTGSREPIIYANDRAARGDVYLYVCHYLEKTEDHPAIILTRPPDAALESQLRSHRRCWIVYTGNAATLARLMPNATIDIQAGVTNNPTIFGEVVWKTPK